MNKSVIIVLAGGALVAVLVAVLVSAVIGGGDKKEQVQVVQQVERIEILVASKEITVGEVLGDDNLDWKKWPQNGTFPGTIIRKDKEKLTEAISGRMKYPVSQGMPIIKDSVIEGEGNFVAASLKPGMRAIALNVKPFSIAGGFIGPGDMVDVLITYNVKIKAPAVEKDVKAAQQMIIDEQVKKFATETIMQNIQAIAIPRDRYSFI